MAPRAGARDRRYASPTTVAPGGRSADRARGAAGTRASGALLAAGGGSARGAARRLSRRAAAPARAARARARALAPQSISRRCGAGAAQARAARGQVGAAAGGALAFGRERGARAPTPRGDRPRREARPRRDGGVAAGARDAQDKS